MVGSNGTAYSRENRVMIKGIKEDISEIKNSVTDLANHYSQRLPTWATAMIAFLASLTVGAITYGLLR